MTPAQFRLRLLKQEVVRPSRLYIVRENPGRRNRGRTDRRAESDAWQRARLLDGLKRNPLRFIHQSPVGEAELVGPGWRENVMIRENKVPVSLGLIREEAGKVHLERRVGAVVKNVPKRETV